MDVPREIVAVILTWVGPIVAKNMEADAESIPLITVGSWGWIQFLLWVQNVSRCRQYVIILYCIMYSGGRENCKECSYVTDTGFQGC